jgi:hypothetical protein
MGITQRLGTIPLAIQTDASNNVGIGAAPSGSYKLEVTGTGRFTGGITAQTGEFLSAGQDGSTGSVVRIGTTNTNAAARNWGIVNSWDNFGDLTFRVSNAQGGNALSAGSTKMVILSSGNVGIGTSSPANYFTTTLTIDGSSSQGIMFRASGTDRGFLFQDGSFIQLGSNAGGVIFKSADTERMRITSGGFTKMSNDGTYFGSTGTYHELRSNVADFATIISNTASSPSGLFVQYVNASPNGTGNSFLYCRDSSLTDRFVLRSNGGLANYSGNNVNLASDKRLKKDIIPLSNEWDRLKQIEVVKYKYKDSQDKTDLYGAIAQQIQEIYPDLVVVTREATETEPEYYGLREQPFQWLTTKVLQEAMAKIEELNERLNKAGL